MATRRHPFDLIRSVVMVHTQALEQFTLIRAGLDEENARQFVPCSVTDHKSDAESFDATLAGVTLRCVLGLDVESKRGVLEIYHVKRNDKEHPVLLGNVPFRIGNGYTDLRHFSEYEEDTGEQLQLTNPYGIKEVLGKYFLQVLMPTT